MTRKEKLQNPSFRELRLLGDALADAAKRHIEGRDAKSHADFVKAYNNWRTASKALASGKLFEQPTLFDPDADPFAEGAD